MLARRERLPGRGNLLGLVTMTCLVPPISILLGWVFLAENPAALAFLGGALCLAGVAVARRR